MATAVKRIEKVFLLKMLWEEQFPVMYLSNQTEYLLRVEKPGKGQMFFSADRPVTGLRAGKQMELFFDYRGQVISFSVEVSGVEGVHITTVEPDYLYKSLNRLSSRAAAPGLLDVQFTFKGDRYSLSYPKVTAYDSGEVEGFVQHLDPANLQELISQIAAWVKSCADGYKLVIFRDLKPASLEERIIAGTGKILYLPSTAAAFIGEDPYPQKNLITGDVFLQWLEKEGAGHARGKARSKAPGPQGSAPHPEEALAGYMKRRLREGVYSDAWVPLLFQEYVIGYVHIWISREGRPPFNYEVIDTLFQFAKILSFSLKVNGYFDDGKIENKPLEGKIIDLSASGLLFSYPASPAAQALAAGAELSLRLRTPKRDVVSGARVSRRYHDRSYGYFGCRFTDMAPEDLRFLFEFLYGTPFGEKETALL